LKIPKITFDRVISGDSNFLPAASPIRVKPERVLYRIQNRQNPEWSTEFRTQFPRFRVFQHLALKGLLEELNQRERVLLSFSTVNLRELPFLFFKLLTKQEEQKKVKLSLLHYLISEKYRFPLIPESPRRFYRSFEPKLEISRVWNPIPLPRPKRYIGVGHSDTGSRSSTPSWMELQSEEQEELPNNQRIKMLILRFLRFSSVAGSRPLR